MAGVSETASFLKNIEDNFLNCVICQDRYEDAKCLQCMHNFCKLCLERLVWTKSNIKCPVCRCKQPVPSGGIAQLPSNFFLNELVREFTERGSKQEKSLKCRGCQTGERTTRCIECGIFLCEHCALTHKNIPATSSHELMSIEDYEAAKFVDPASVESPMYCSKHSTHPLKFYCDTCKVTICLECTALDHKITEHDYRYLEDAKADCTRELKELFAKLKLMLQQVKAVKQATQTRLQAVSSRKVSEEKKLGVLIDETIMELTRMITEDGKRLMEELRSDFDDRISELDTKLKELDINENYLTNVVEFVEQLIREGNAAKMLSAKQGMALQTEELQTMMIYDELVEDVKIEFKKSEDFFTDKSLGKFMCSNAANYKLHNIPTFARVDTVVRLPLKKGEQFQGKSQEVTNDDIIAVIKTPDDKIDYAKVTEGSDDTFSISYSCKVPGCHELSVWVGDKPAEGSPYAIKVVPKKGLVKNVGHDQRLGRDNIAGVALIRKRHLILCDGDNSMFHMYDLVTGGEIKDMQPTISGQPCRPILVAVSARGHIFFTEYATKQVFVCNENGKLIRCFGRGTIVEPRGIAISPINGSVYVADKLAHCIRKYREDGSYLKSFGSEGDKDGQFILPLTVCVAKSGNIIVSDGTTRVQVFDDSDTFMYKFDIGDLAMFVATDKNDNIFVGSYDNGQIRKFDSLGNYICRIDSDGDGLKAIADGCVTDDEPCQVIVSDLGNGYIRVYSL